MPGHDGLWLATQLQRDHPHTAVVIATAFTDLLDGEQKAPVADLLIKPFQRERFTLAVDQRAAVGENRRSKSSNGTRSCRWKCRTGST